MSWRGKKEPDPEPISRVIKAPKPPSLIEQLKSELQDIETIIAAKTAERQTIYDNLLWLQFTPQAEERMKQIWERLKPRT